MFEMKRQQGRPTTVFLVRGVCKRCASAFYERSHFSVALKHMTFLLPSRRRLSLRRGLSVRLIVGAITRTYVDEFL